MKKLIFSLSLLFVAGCRSVPEAAKSAIQTNALISDAFVLLMEEDQTTREQEQSFIRAQRKAWHSQNFAVNEVTLPADLTPRPEGSPLPGLLETLQQDLRVRAKARELKESLDKLNEELNPPAPNNDENGEGQ